MLPSLRVALDVGFVALGVALSVFSFPIGPARVFPFQHMINVLVGVLLGPWDAVMVAAIVGIIRNAIGLGTVLAFVGMFGGLVVGTVYRYVWRNDNVAWLESIGTVVVGGTLGYLLLLPVTQPTSFLGFMPGRPLVQEFLGFTGMFALWASFAVSSGPGSALGYVVLKALRRTGLPLFADG
jgi:energy-coupling factor transport system ATP-binding protein